MTNEEVIEELESLGFHHLDGKFQLPFYGRGPGSIQFTLTNPVYWQFKHEDGVFYHNPGTVNNWKATNITSLADLIVLYK